MFLIFLFNIRLNSANLIISQVFMSLNSNKTTFLDSTRDFYFED